MRTLAEVCSATVAFAYRSIDRLILTVYIPTLQTPGAMAICLRTACKKPILSGLVFKWLTDRFVTQLRTFAQPHLVPIVPVKGRTRPGLVGQRLLRRAARRGRWGVVAIVVHQKSARVFASYHAGGRPTNFRVKADRRLINHYSGISILFPALLPSKEPSPVFRPDPAWRLLRKARSRPPDTPATRHGRAGNRFLGRHPHPGPLAARTIDE